jgi:hypothetical protein
MMIRNSLVLVAVASLLAGCATPTAPLERGAPRGPSFDGVIGPAGNHDASESGTTVSAEEGDATGRSNYTLGSGS